MAGKAALAVLSFLFPIIGWILCLCLSWRHRELASVCSKWSTIGFGLQLMALMILGRSIHLVPSGQAVPQP